MATHGQLLPELVPIAAIVVPPNRKRSWPQDQLVSMAASIVNANDKDHHPWDSRSAA